MLAGLFDEEVTYDTSPKSSSSDKKGTNCAEKLTEPEMTKSESNFVGLYNQGGTCYMNSSLQILYMTPKFRNLINSLFLCEKILGNPTTFIPQGQKYNIVLSLQKLFSEMNLLNIKATKTKELTEAFGWTTNEGGDQHDSQEFIRILLFDVLERILYDTPFNNIINNIYKVNYISNMKCNQCGNINTKIESEYVLNLQVMNMKGLKESLFSSFGFEEIIEDYKCEKCEQKVNLQKWSKIISLPNYISFGLNRFTYDYNTFERIKLNTRFEFPLEINMKEYCDFNELNTSNDEEYLYELYGVIVHSGTPYSGHYYSYIRDMTGQGKWEIINKEKKEKKDNKNEKKEENNKEEKNDEKEEKNNNDNKINDNNNNNNINEINDNENQNEINDDNIDNKKKKGKRRRKGKKDEKMKKNEKNNNKNKEAAQKNAKQDNSEDPNKDFSIPYENKSLKENWFEFNDTSITSMPISRLEKAFKGKASAYMLFYSKKENAQKKTELLPPPDYLINFMKENNEKLEKERIEYEKEKNSFITVTYKENMFKLNKEDQILSLNNEIDKKFLIEKKYSFNDKVSKLFEDEKLENKKCFLFYIINKNDEKIVIIEKVITEEFGEISLKEAGLYHYCNIVFCDNNNDIFDLNIIKIGKDYEPVYLKFFFNGNIFDLRTFGCYYMSQLKDMLEKKINLKKENFEISFMNGKKQIFLINDVIKNKNTGNEKNLKDLNLEKKNLLTIVPKDNCILEENHENKYMINDINNIDNEKNLTSCIIKFEDDENTVEILKISLDKTFLDLYKEVYDKFPIIKEKTENENENGTKEESIIKDNNFKFRLFNELDNKIIHKELFSQKLLTSPLFVEGDVRLRIEIGEIYSENEISLTIIMKSPYEENKQLEREFICDPGKYTLFQIKKFLLDNFIINEEQKEKEKEKEKEKQYDNYLLYRVNVYNLPTKPYKNEKETLSVVGIKERDILYLQNITEIPNEMAYINVIYSDKKIYYYDLMERFEPIFFDDKKKLELKLPKKTTVLELKTKINEKISPNLLLVRVIGKYNQLERILKNDNYTLKKYNLESPINLFVEELEEPIFNVGGSTGNIGDSSGDGVPDGDKGGEKRNKKNKNKKNKNNNNTDNIDNDTLIVLMQRNKKENKYINKKTFYIQNDPNIFGTKELYELCRIHTNWMNISVAKYNRGMYEYEEILEYDENNNSMSLKKGNYFLRDSDWVAIKNLDEDDEFKTDFDIEQKKEIQKKKEEMKKLKSKERSKKVYEKPLRIKLDD